LEIEDLSRQHQFKDDFLNDVITEIEHIENEIHNQLRMLIGGVDQTGAYIYEIKNGSHTGHQRTGYATIGSGTQPAESEFIKSQFAKSRSADEGLETCAAALHAAQEASGVGGTVDIAAVSLQENRRLDRGLVKDLMEREESISLKQEDIREHTIENNPINWRDGI
jgi:uncharacterized Ntn-hydrolase superfamily protein